MSTSQRKMLRRMRLLDDLLDYALRSECRFAMCDGPFAPIRNYKTCSRCACIHRAAKMGLVVRVGEQYVRKTPQGDCVVAAGYPEQFSAVDGRRI